MTLSLSLRRSHPPFPSGQEIFPFRRKNIQQVGPSSADLPCCENFTIVGDWDAQLSTVYVEADRQCYLPGETGRMKVVATLEDTTRVCLKAHKPVFTSSNEAAATVDADGVITAKAPGTALITAAVTYEGKTVTRALPVAVKG